MFQNRLNKVRLAAPIFNITIDSPLGFLNSILSCSFNLEKYTAIATKIRVKHQANL